MKASKMKNYKNRLNLTLELKANPSKSLAAEYFPCMEDELTLDEPTSKKEVPVITPSNIEKPAIIKGLPELTPSDTTFNVTHQPTNRKLYSKKIDKDVLNLDKRLKKCKLVLIKMKTYLQLKRIK